MNILVFILVSVFLGIAWYLLQLWFFEIIKKSAATKKSRFVIFPKEKRTLQRTLGLEFDTFWYNSADECFAYQKYPKRNFLEERYRWEIVSGRYNILKGLNWWQAYIYKNTGAWWYQGWSLQYKIAEREIDISHYEPATTIGEQGRMVKLEDNKTIYLFRTFEGYGVVISAAEDATGNPVTVYLVVRGRVQNPYIAEVEIKDWDTLFAAKIRAKGAAIIHKSHFYKSIPVDENFLKKYDIKSADILIDHDEIIEVLAEELTKILSDPSENGGFEFDSVIVQNIILENKAITDAIANTVVSEEAKKQAINEAEGLAAKEEFPGRAQNTVRKERMEDMMKNLPAARLLATENSLKGAQAISLGGNEALFFNYEIDGNNKKQTTKKEMEVTDEKK